MDVMLGNHMSSQGPYSGINKIMIGDRPMEPKFIGIHTSKAMLDLWISGLRVKIQEGVCLHLTHLIIERSEGKYSTILSKLSTTAKNSFF